MDITPLDAGSDTSDTASNGTGDAVSDGSSDTVSDESGDESSGSDPTYRVRGAPRPSARRVRHRAPRDPRGTPRVATNKGLTLDVWREHIRIATYATKAGISKAKQAERGSGGGPGWLASWCGEPGQHQKERQGPWAQASGVGNGGANKPVYLFR